jgi:hypothetical protein
MIAETRLKWQDDGEPALLQVCIIYKVGLFSVREPLAMLRFCDQRDLILLGSAQEFDGACILSRFLKNDKFCFCDRHALRLEQ